MAWTVGAVSSKRIMHKWIHGDDMAAAVPLVSAVLAGCTVGVVVGTRTLFNNPDLALAKSSRNVDGTEARAGKHQATDGERFKGAPLRGSQRKHPPSTGSGGARGQALCGRGALAAARADAATPPCAVPTLLPSEHAFRRYLRTHFFNGPSGTLDNSTPFLMSSFYGGEKR